MKPRLSTKRNAAVTLFEVGIAVAVVVILTVIFLPRVARQHAMPPMISCANNLKQTVLAYNIWEGDNGDILPMGISITNGGSQELVAMGNVVATFQVMSNELSTPKVLLCPEDVTRTASADFAGLANSHVSYFVSADATNDLNPRMLLAGDSNFEMGGVPVGPGLRRFGTNDPVIWTKIRHGNITGNIGLADGSVQSATIVSWNHDLDLQETGLATNSFAIP